LFIDLLRWWFTISDTFTWIDTWCSRWLYWDYGWWISYWYLFSTNGWDL